MTITQLRYFQKACKLDNITRAAEALHVSQPSVSAAIRELEEEYGFALLERRGRSFSLTPNGAVFLAEADRLLSHVSDFETAMVRLAQGPGQLKVGVPPMIGSLVLPLIYTGEEHRRTPFDLGIVEAGRQELLQRLSAGELDLAFIPHDRPLSASYTGIAVTILETVCCTSLFHPLAGQERPCGGAAGQTSRWRCSKTAFSRPSASSPASRWSILLLMCCFSRISCPPSASLSPATRR